ncbi:MAG: hypothetical protein AAFZ35_13430 [Cyanobacteria bacterium J06649_12]
MHTKLWTLLTLSFLATTLGVAGLQHPLVAQSPVPPVVTVPVPQSLTTVRLVNQTAAPITYEALGDTQSRLLMAGDEVTLQNLNTPATLTFFYGDIPKDRQTGEGLLQAALGVDEDTGTLDVVISPTTALDADVSNITIEANGNVFVF